MDSYVSEAWFNLGQVHFLNNQYDEAIEAYDYALAINEKDSISLVQKAHAHFQLGHWEKAIEAYQEYVEIIPEKWQIWLFIGECYEKLEALIGISICLLEMEQFQESMEYIHEALKISNEMADAWIYLAEAKIGLGEYEQALEAYHQAVSIDPKQPDSLLAMGNIYMDNANFETALKFYELAHSYDCTLEYIELFIAVASYYTEDYVKAATFLELAINRNLDAPKLFLELCPDAQERFSKLTRLTDANDNVN